MQSIVIIKYITHVIVKGTDERPLHTMSICRAGTTAGARGTAGPETATEEPEKIIGES